MISVSERDILEFVKIVQALLEQIFVVPTTRDTFVQGKTYIHGYSQ